MIAEVIREHPVLVLQLLVTWVVSTALGILVTVAMFLFFNWNTKKQETATKNSIEKLYAEKLEVIGKQVQDHQETSAKRSEEALKYMSEGLNRMTTQIEAVSSNFISTTKQIVSSYTEQQKTQTEDYRLLVKECTLAFIENSKEQTQTRAAMKGVEESVKSMQTAVISALNNNRR